MTPEARWHLAQTAVALLSRNPKGLRGISIRARCGPVRDRLLETVGELTTIRPEMDTAALFGGLDLTATLAAGKPVYLKGLVEQEGARLRLASAERAERGFSAQLATAIDANDNFSLYLLDEGVDDEAAAHALTDRLAFWITLDDVPLSATTKALPTGDMTAPSRVHVSKEARKILVSLSLTMGVRSIRPLIFALEAAKTHAAFAGRSEVTQDDLEMATLLVLAPRAEMIPDAQEDAPDDPETDDSSSDDRKDQTDPLEDKLVDAARAALPPDLLAQLIAQRSNRAPDRGTMEATSRNRGTRGRPRPSRPGKLGRGQRVDLPASLRAATIWQRIRRDSRKAAGQHPRKIDIRTSDIHLRHFKPREERLLCFLVDASGSAAANRLGEAKGAVELLLADAYAARDFVTLIAYRKEGADTLLAPTRSLVAAKKQLAGLPGGGATPLAHGLEAASHAITSARRKGAAPALIVVAEGRANIARDGTADRAQAAADALTAADAIRSLGAPGLVLDMSRRPEPQLAELASRLGVAVIPVPRADAKQLSATVHAALPRGS